MGHKVHPTGFRIGVIKSWQAKWYADRHYASYLAEDLKIRQAIEVKYPEAAISSVEIERQSNQVVATIHTARPGIVIGRGGQRVDEARTYLEKTIGKRIQLNIKEVQQPELDAKLVARSIADQLERRIAYRRAMKQAITRTLQAGGKGIKVAVAGRLGGAEIARRLNMHEGRVPLHTLRADIDYGFCEARTVMGRIGVKAWIYKGDILPEAKAQEAEVTVAPAVPVAVVTPAAPATIAETKPTEVMVAEKTESTVPEVVAPEAKHVAEEKIEVIAEVVPSSLEETTTPPTTMVTTTEGEKKIAKPRKRVVRKKVTKPETTPDQPVAEPEEHDATT
jgi:small subunit ribosomal protein S3